MKFYLKTIAFTYKNKKEQIILDQKEFSDVSIVMQM